LRPTNAEKKKKKNKVGAMTCVNQLTNNPAKNIDTGGGDQHHKKSQQQREERAIGGDTTIRERVTKEEVKQNGGKSKN